MLLTLQEFLVFLSLLVPLTISPGPVNITLAGLGSTQGMRRSMPFVGGLILAGFVIAYFGGMGLNQVFVANPDVYRAVQYAGIAYIFYLAFKFLRQRPSVQVEGAASHGFIDGLLLTTLNPKFYVMIAVLFGQFLKPGDDRTLLLSALFIFVLACSQFVWLAAGRSLKLVLHSPAMQRAQSIGFAVLLAGAATYMLNSA